MSSSGVKADNLHISLGSTNNLGGGFSTVAAMRLPPGSDQLRAALRLDGCVTGKGRVELLARGIPNCQERADRQACLSADTRLSLPCAVLARRIVESVCTLYLR